MVGVCIQANSNESLMNQWDYILCNFKPDVIYVLGEYNHQSNVFKNAVAISSLEEIHHKLVVLAPKHGRHIQGTISLDDYKHQEDCVYFFGSDSRTPTTDMFEGIDADYIYIETDTTDDMYSFTSYAVVAWDRRMK